MTGLMYYRPEDHVHYMLDCLRKLKDDGIQRVCWNIFIDQQRKSPLVPLASPLPPITPPPENGLSSPVQNTFTGKPCQLTSK